MGHKNAPHVMQACDFKEGKDRARLDEALRAKSVAYVPGMGQANRK